MKRLFTLLCILLIDAAFVSVSQAQNVEPEPETAIEYPLAVEDQPPEPTVEHPPATEREVVEPIDSEEQVTSELEPTTGALSASSTDELPTIGQKQYDLANNVGTGGEFTYSFDFQLPDFRGLQPDLSLSYNSSNTSRGGVTNIVALGWRLSGLSRIERQSVGGGVPTFDDGQDVFVLDGQELMACKDNAATQPWTGFYPFRYHTDRQSASCTAGGNFSTRIESYAKIVYSTATNQFVVTRTDGTRLTYQSVGSLIPSHSAAFSGEDAELANKSRWVLTRIEDTHAQTVLISYFIGASTADPSLLDGLPERPAEITYAGYRIAFNYSPSLLPAVANFGTGTRYLGAQRYRLKSITIYDGSTKIRAYNLVGTSTALTGAWLLNKIETHGSSFSLAPSTSVVTSSTKLPDLSFAYSADTFALTSKTYPGATFTLNNLVTDWDTNGTDHFLMLGQIANYWYYVPAGSGGQNIVNATYTFPKAHYTVDANRNLVSRTEHLASFCGLGNENEPPNLGNAIWFQASQEVMTGYRLFAPRVCFGSTDTSQETGSGVVRYNRSIYVDNVVSGIRSAVIPTLVDSTERGPDPIVGNFDLDPEFEVWAGGLYDIIGDQLSYSGYSTLMPTGGFIADFTGDGVDDVARYNQLSLTVFEGGTLSSNPANRGDWYSKGVAGPLPQIPPSTAPNSDANAFLGISDMNGDELLDVVYYDAKPGGQGYNPDSDDMLSVFYSTGRGFLPVTRYKLPNLILTSLQGGLQEEDLQVVDVNGDSLGDLVLHVGFGVLDYRNTVFTSGPTHILLNTGSGFALQSINGSSSFTGLVGLGDFDGNGLKDFLIEGNDGKILFNQGSASNRMVGVTTASGGQIAVAYVPSSRFGADQTPGVRQVVGSITRSDGRGGTSTVGYFYANGRYDFVNRRPLGYGTVVAQFPAIAGEVTGPKLTTSYYNNHIASYGLEQISVVTDSSGTVLSEVETGWLINSAGNGPYRAVEIVNRSKSLFGSSYIETVKQFTHGLYGQVSTTIDFGLTSGGYDIAAADNTIETVEYALNLGSYIVNKPRTRRVQSGVVSSQDLSTWLSADFFYYDQRPLVYGAPPTKGDLFEHQQWKGSLTGLDAKVIGAWTYDAFGNAITQKDGLGFVTTNTYDTIKGLFRLSTTNPMNQAEVTTWNYPCQLPVSKRDANLLFVYTVYDEHCREIRKSLPTTNTNPSVPTGGLTLDPIFTNVTSYVGMGNPSTQYVQRSSRSPSATSGWEWTIDRAYLDGFGRTYKKAVSGTTYAESDLIVSLAEYDVRGNLAWESIPLTVTQAASPGALATSQKISHAYDALDRRIQTVDAAGALTTYDYITGSYNIVGVFIDYPGIRTRDAHCFDLVSANTICGLISKFYDHGGRKSRVVLSDNAATDIGAGGITFRITKFDYDLLGRLKTVVDPAGFTSSYNYDAHGNRIQAIEPSGFGTWNMSYDANNNLLTQMDSKGQIISFSYDVLNRPTLKGVSRAPGQVETETYFTYDEPRAGYFNIGKQTSQAVWTTANGSSRQHLLQRDYNHFGSVQRERHEIDGRAYALEYSFALDGSLLDQKLPNTPGAVTSGWVGALSYDAAGRPVSMSTRIAGITYNIWSQPTQISFANAAYETYLYNAANGLVTTIDGFQAGGGRSFRAIYTRTATGRISRYDTGSISTDVGGSFDFTYDYAGRLLTATNFQGASSFNQVMTYDAAGRIRSKSQSAASPVTYTYGGTGTNGIVVPGHAPRLVGSTALTYDQNGNMLTGLGGRIITYDAENRPSSVIRNGFKTCYVYGADGARLKRIDKLAVGQACGAGVGFPATAVVTTYFGPVEVRNWMVAGSEQVLTHPHPKIRLTNGAPSYLHTDALGSVRAVTSAAGAVEQRAVYKPYGEKSSNITPGVTVEDQGWIGERYDIDAGLQYLNARYYDPEMGMFLQPDWFEVTKPGVGTNRFAYGLGDPVNLRDPNGNTAFADWGMDQTEADAENKRQGDMFSQRAKDMRSSEEMIDSILEVLGAASRLEDEAQRAYERIGMSQSDRIRMDLGEAAATALMGLRPSAGITGAKAAPQGGVKIDFELSNSTKIAPGPKLSANSAPQFEVKSSAASAIRELEASGYSKSLKTTRRGTTTVMSKGNKSYSFYESTGGGNPAAPRDVPSADVQIDGRTVSKLRFLGD